MMFDAAAVVALQDAAASADAASHDAAIFADRTSAEPAHEAPAAEPVHAPASVAEERPADMAADMSGASSAPSRDVIFIDTSVADYRELAAAWADQGDVVLIDGTRDGVAQMQAALAGHQNVGAIHIVSHGSDGQFWLGTTRVDEAAISGSLASAFAQIGQSLSQDGDILIYGCNFAEGAAGASAMAALARATDADIAASTDVTGYAARGGDWVLESHSGAIEARTLQDNDWVHTLAPNSPIPISVTPDSLIVIDGAGTTIVTGTTGYGSDSRSPDVGLGAVAIWSNVATFNGQQVDLRATVVSLSAGDAVRFNRPTGTGFNADDPTFLLRDLTAANDATVEIRWELVVSGTTTPLPADVRFTIADIDGIGGNPNTRETVSASTTGLAYYTRENITDINFTSSLDTISASGTQNENTVANQPITSASAATFDWSNVSSFTLTYRLTTNAVTTNAQFYHDGDADFIYTDPVYVSIPRLDLDGNDSTAAGNDAHFTYTEGGVTVPIVDSDVVVTNPMPSSGIIGATVTLTNYHAGDTFTFGSLPSNISASIGAVTNGALTITLTGNGSEADYANAFRAISFSNSSDAPDTTQRVINVSFRNDVLTSALATSRIDVIAVNDAPVRVGTLPAQAAVDAQAVSYATAGGFADPDGDALAYSATGLPAGLTINTTTGVISGVINRSASQTTGGVYTVVVTARDPSNTSTTQSFTISVTNPPPVAVNDSASTNEDVPVTINVLANDSDPDGDPLTVTVATAQHGTVTINPDNSLTYNPDADYHGSDTISYSISDGQGGTASATVAVTISPVNDAPVATGTLPPRSALDGDSVSYPTSGVFSDVDGDALSYSASGLPLGLVIDAATGLISGTIDRSASQQSGGVYTVTVTARDPSNASATRSFTISVANPGPTAVNDNAATNEDTPVTIDVLANDSDPDGDPLTVTAATAQHGTVTINPDNSLTYTPDADYHGSDSIDYTISDGQGGTSAASVTVTIAPVNDAPVAVGTLPARTADDAQPVSYPTAGAFADVDGDTLTYSATGLPAGLIIDPATGVISGTIDRSASQSYGGAYAVTVTARDGGGATATQGFTLQVNNPPPVANDDSVTTHIDRPVVFAVLGNDSDPDGDPLSVTAATAGLGTVTINPDGSLRYVPPAGYTGTDTISYTISDGQGGTASATVTVSIGNAPPVTSPNSAVSAHDGQVINLPIGSSFSDSDGDPLSFTATGLPPGLSIDPATGLISGTIDPSASRPNGGIYTTTVTADDGHGGVTSSSFTWTIDNPAPVARDDSVTTAEDTPVTIDVLANDSDPDNDALTVIAASAGHGTVTINADRTLLYTPDRDYNGTDTIFYTISDADGARSTAKVTVTITPVDDAPVAQGLPPRITADGVTVSVPAAPGFVDPEGDPLTYSATGLPPGLSIDPVTGVISGTIAPGSAYGGPAGDGVYNAVITATDPSGSSVSAPLSWQVSQTAPIAVDDSATTPEDTPISVPVLANDSDPDNDPLTIVAATSPHGTVVIDGGNLIFTPAADFNGNAIISYTISDPSGNRATATLTVAVTPVNDAPTASPIPAVHDRDGDTVALDVGTFFTDVDGDTLTYTASGLPPGLSIDPVTGRISGIITPNASQIPGGVYPVTITATDPFGVSVDSNFDWSVSNIAPTAVPDSATVAEDGSITLDVLTNDVDPDGDPLTVVAATAGHGVVTINPDGTLTYVPAANFHGSDVILYTIDDGNGGRSTASVAITVTPVPDAPAAFALPPERNLDADSVSLDIAGFFTDADGDALAFTATGLPPGLSIDPVTGVISGTIDRAASQSAGGLYGVTVTATDPTGLSASSSFVWTVVNPGPVAVDDQASTGQDVATIIAVLANDSDPDGDPLTVIDAVASHGVVTINPDGTLTYAPAAGFHGNDVIVYTIDDGNGGQSTASVFVTVIPPNRPPVIAPLPDVPATSGYPATIDPRPSLSDPDGDSLTIVDATPAIGTVTINPDGTLSYTPPPDFTGTTTIVIVVSDGRGGTSSGTVTVIVSPPIAPDMQQLQGIGRDPAPFAATPRPAQAPSYAQPPLVQIKAAEDIRSLRSTAIGAQPVGDAVEAIRSLRGTSVDPDTPILAEVARLEALRDQRDAGDRLFDQRWGDFMVKGLTGFSVAGDAKAGIMIESIAHGSALYVEVRDTSDGHAPIRKVDIRMADGKRLPAWIRVDPRGMAIIERSAGQDELHLVVRVTRSDGHVSSTPILVQGETGEIELDRKHGDHAKPLHATPLQTPSAAIQAEAMRLAQHFQ